MVFVLEQIYVRATAPQALQFDISWQSKYRNLHYLLLGLVVTAHSIHIPEHLAELGSSDIEMLRFDDAELRGGGASLPRYALRSCLG